MNKHISLFFIFTLATGSIIAQEYVVHEESDHAFLHHRLSGGFGYTFIPEGGESDDHGIFAPTIAIEYFYKFSHHWAAGLMMDMELTKYIIPFNNEYLNRDKLLIFTVVGMYEPIEYWGIIAGAGIEIEHHHNFAVLRAGTGYEFDIGNHWDITPTLTFDFKEEYSSWALILSCGKRF